MTRQHLIRRVEAILLRRREALRRSLTGELTQFNTFDNPVVGDSVDRALDTEYAEITFELADTETRELAQIEYALTRLQEGHYGICEGCGRQIPLARLKAIPHATMCIHCRKLCEQGLAIGQGTHVRRQRQVTNLADRRSLDRLEFVA